MLLGATLAGQAFSNSPVAAVHALAYPLGGHFHVPHGLSNALVLVHVLRFNRQAALPLYAELAAVLPGEGCPAEPAGAAAYFIARMAALVHATGTPPPLRDDGVDEHDLAILASDPMLHQPAWVQNLLSRSPYVKH